MKTTSSSEKNKQGIIVDLLIYRQGKPTPENLNSQNETAVKKHFDLHRLIRQMFTHFMQWLRPVHKKNMELISQELLFEKLTGKKYRP